MFKLSTVSFRDFKVVILFGGSCRGIDYLGVKSTSVTNPRTKGQANPKNKFSASIQFCNRIKNSYLGYKVLAIKKNRL